MNINNIKDNKVIIKTSNISQIKIPMIQRDYVQSLDEQKFKKFLNVLVEALNNGTELSLDFIYGNINEDGVFEPIDGQQRLTTLALLTFYLYCRQSENILQNPFEYITYATRQSANNFCQLLRGDKWKNKFNDTDNPSNIIKNDIKYFKEYDDDTTIFAMLQALDKIHNSIKNQDIDSLTKNISNISFHIFPMESFNLSDDLYIKMNGRGKQLSSFDNFKADYFKWLEENEIEDTENIKRKFNNEYIDIVWDFAFANNDNKLPDPEKLFFRFINRFIVGKYLLLTKEEKDEFKNNKEKNEFEEIFFDKNGIKSERDEVKYQQMDIYAKIFKKNNNHKKLINILNNLIELKKCKKEKFKEFLLEIFTSSWKEKIDIFTNDVKNALTMQKVLVFNTIISYFEIERDFTNIIYMDNILKRISRIVWNIAEQYNTFTAPSLINRENYHNPAEILSFISELHNNECVYDALNDKFENTNLKDSDNLNAIDMIYYDELIKCNTLINNNKNIKNIDYNEDDIERKLILLESLEFLHGTIGFLRNKNTLSLSDNLINICNKIFSNEENHNLFIRALLSKIDEIEILKSNIYKSKNNIKQLINETKFRENAREILESIENENMIQNILITLVKSHSHLKNINIKNYRDFTALTTHESLYREKENIDNYKIHFTSDSYWLMKQNYKSATTLEMRSYCPVRCKLINGLKNINNEQINNNKFTERNVHINIADNKIMFELNSIFIGSYNNKFYIHDSFNNLNSLDINEHAVSLYDIITEKSDDLNLKVYLETNKERFIKIINEINSYINPFEYNSII